MIPLYQTKFDKKKEEIIMPEREMKVHAHPLDPEHTVNGYRLLPGEILQPDDVYDSTTGKWEVVPCPNLAISEKSGAYYVRPVG